MGEAKRRQAHIAAGGEDWGLKGFRSRRSAPKREPALGRNGYRAYLRCRKQGMSHEDAFQAAMRGG